MKFGIILAYIVLLTSGLAYVVTTERTISNLRNELFTSKANEEQQKIELKNNKAIIVAFDKTIKQQQATEKQKQEKIKETAEKIATMTVQEKINTINNIFNNL